ncbi:histidine kinase [Arcticibacter tournemirensis]
MKNQVKGGPYLLLPAVIVVISFLAVAFFINWRLGKSAETIGGTLTAGVQRHKEVFFRSRFNELLDKVELARQTASQELRNGKEPELFKTILFSDPIINHIWYAPEGKGESQFASQSRKSVADISTINDKKIRERISEALASKNSYSDLVKDNGSVRWIYGVKAVNPRTKAAFFLGFNLDMRELQKYMEEADPEGQAYAFITDEEGVSIFYPDQKLIGKRVLTPGELQFVKSDSAKRNLMDTLESDFLGVRVVRKYSSFAVAGQPWLFIVDTPTLLVDDEINSISKYSALLGLFSLVVILITGAYSQRKWLKEFLLRQSAEDEQQSLLLEKQKLLLMAEKQEKENALLQLDKLKQKINPHFLFNSLGSLSALIGREPETAKTFVMKLSKVYRYVLNEFPGSLSSVQSEIDFAEQYTYLLRVRFGDALKILHTDIDIFHLQGKLPFMAIQTAVENAVKHNVVSKEQPLTISVRSDGDKILVESDFQPRSTPADSGGYGLNYIRSIYDHYKIAGFSYKQDGDVFICSFPVIQQSNIQID